MPLSSASSLPTRRTLAAWRRQAGFTMVEIALCLGVIAIALVAIIGVMPTGLQVQRDNREDTILNQDGRFFLEAIRSGARGSDHLTNFVLSIVWSNSVGDRLVHTNSFGRNVPPGHTNSLVNGRAIVGYLSTNRYVLVNDRLVTNYVTALVRSMAGTAESRGERWRVGTENTPPESLPPAFNYLMSLQISPLITKPPALTNFTSPGLEPAQVQVLSNNWLRARNQAANFSEVRLTLQGPVFQRGNTLDTVGRSKTFRTIVSGIREVTEDEQLPLFRPGVFVQVTP